MYSRRGAGVPDDGSRDLATVESLADEGGASLQNVSAMSWGDRARQTRRTAALAARRALGRATDDRRDRVSAYMMWGGEQGWKEERQRGCVFFLGQVREAMMMKSGFVCVCHLNFLGSYGTFGSLEL